MSSGQKKIIKTLLYIFLHSELHSIQLVVCFIHLPVCLISKIRWGICPLRFIPWKSFSGTVRSLRLHVQNSEPSPPTSPGGHTIPSYISGSPPPQGGTHYSLSPSIDCCYFFTFDCPQVCEAIHLDRRYFNRCKDMQKMFLAHKQTCSHVEGMFLQLRFQPDFLGQILEQLTPPPRHTHT